MINEEREMVVFLAVIDYGPDEGGEIVASVHDTYEWASRALKNQGFRPTCVFGARGAVYAYKGKTADDYPMALIDDWKVDA